jgi:hypothetical protein
MDKITIKSVNFLSDDTALTDNSSGLVPTQHAVKAYVDANSGGTESCPYVYCNGSGVTANHSMYGNITAQAEL